jgi:hypothetical protein
MARKIDEIRLIQQKINGVISQAKGVDVTNFDASEKRYFLGQKQFLEALQAPLAKPTWFGGYQDCIYKLRVFIDSLLQGGEFNRASKSILLLAFYAAQNLIGQCLDYLTKKKEEKQTNPIEEIILLQKKIEDGLEVFFPKREKIFNLNLGELRSDYEKSYKREHGSGDFMRLFVLPIKRVLRQESRDNELKFIEDINKYLLKNDAEISGIDKQYIKLTALNLVRLKIETEFFGENSLLVRLIGERINKAGYANNEGMLKDFPRFCLRNKISMPKELLSWYEEWSASSHAYRPS